MSVHEKTFRLELYPPPDNMPVVVSTRPSLGDIDRAIREQSWDDIAFVVLKQDENNWMEVSGSAKPEDGFSARYMEHGEEYVSARPPDSLDEMSLLLQSYATHNDRWKRLIGWK